VLGAEYDAFSAQPQDALTREPRVEHVAESRLDDFHARRRRGRRRFGEHFQPDAMRVERRCRGRK
jgi:hypothetical protein